MSDAPVEVGYKERAQIVRARNRIAAEVMGECAYSTKLAHLDAALVRSELVQVAAAAINRIVAIDRANEGVET